jgi:hypothetical protein
LISNQTVSQVPQPKTTVPRARKSALLALRRGSPRRTESSKQVTPQIKNRQQANANWGALTLALAIRAGLLNKKGPFEVTLPDKLNNFAHLLSW